jgi:D-amino-acid oxidase
MAEGRVVFCGADPDPSWRTLVDDVRPLCADELPPPFRSGFAVRAPVCVMPAYLEGLVERLAARGVHLEVRGVRALDDAFAACATVVNCTGLGARELADDRALSAARGQVVVAPLRGAPRFWVADDAPGGMTYVVPRRERGDAVLGGTYELGRHDAAVDPAQAAAIQARAAQLEPALAEVAPFGHAVGLRPVRPQVRLDLEERPGGRRVVHNYGHGGSGVTLSWGCADEVVALLRGRRSGA